MLHAVTPSVEPSRTLQVRAEYRLDEAGRKASLLHGGTGQARQRVTLTLPATRLHLVQVAKDGTARLTLRPQFRLNAAQRIVRVDARPAYDHLPTIDELLQDAARNHELERAFYAQRTTAAGVRRDANAQWLEQTARDFLADRTRRAIVHPAPTARVCQLMTGRGPMHFYTDRGSALTRQIPLEAHRRFQNDLRVRHGQSALQREQDEATHGERQRLMEAWVTAHGTVDQRQRFAVGLLPKEEWLEALADGTFAPLTGLPPYDANGARTLQVFLRRRPGYEAVVITKDDYRVVTATRPSATAIQWDWMRWVRRQLPTANVHLRDRELIWTGDPRAPRHRTITLLVTMKVGPVRLRREFTIPDAAPAVTEPTKEASVTTV
jgi:hypothetical protein